MPSRTLVIVNPQAGRGRAGRRWPRVEPRVREALGDVEIAHTAAPRDAERLAREAVRAGVERLVVAGGDGTWAEVASGLLAADLGRYAELGLLPMGTGADLARSLGVPRDPAAALALLANGRVRRIDAGRVAFHGHDGKPRRTHFANVASVGVSSLTIDLAARMPRWLGARGGFALGAVAAIVSQRPARVSLAIDGERVLDEPATLVAVANGRAFGGGMQIAPDARLDDGRFDVVSVTGVSGWRLAAKLPKLYRGTHVADPVTRVWRGAKIELASADGPVGLELDGDPLGVLPASIEVLPGALAVIGPAT